MLTLTPQAAKYAEPVPAFIHYSFGTPEVKRIMNLYGFREPVHDSDGVEYIVCPNGRFFYALTPATLDRWFQHIKNCYHESLT